MTWRMLTCSVATVSIATALTSCARQLPDAAPQVRYGEDVCAHCNMILSDERFASATIVDGDRGPTPRLFDDLNCQVDYERQIPGDTILARWVHDHDSRAWVRAEHAIYVFAPSLRTPMASHVAAFSSHESASAMADQLNGQSFDFTSMWDRLATPN